MMTTPEEKKTVTKPTATKPRATPVKKPAAQANVAPIMPNEDLEVAEIGSGY
jgi:hypothetical protein